MDVSERNRLEEAGWNTGDAHDFLGLSDEEVALVAVKPALSDRSENERPDEG